MVTTVATALDSSTFNWMPTTFSSTFTITTTTNMDGQYVYTPHLTANQTTWITFDDTCPRPKPHSDWHFEDCKCGDCPHN